MVRTRAAPARGRTRARSCRCPDSSNRWAALELYDRVKGKVMDVKDGLAEVKQAVLPDEAMKKAKELERTRVKTDRDWSIQERYSFASDTRTRRDSRNPNKFWIDDRVSVEVNVLDPLSIENAKKTIDTYRRSVLTGQHLTASDPQPTYKHDEELRKLKEQSDILSTKAAIKRYKDQLSGKKDEFGRSHASPGRSSKDDILKPGFFAGAVNDGKNTTKVYNYKKVSETAGSLIGDFNYRLAPASGRRTNCTCRRLR